MAQAIAVLSSFVILAASCGSSGPGFCELAREFEDADLSGDAGDLEERVEAALDTLDALVETAPDSIVGDVVIVRNGVEALARGSGDLGRDFAQASARVREHIDEECA